MVYNKHRLIREKKEKKKEKEEKENSYKSLMLGNQPKMKTEYEIC